MRSPAAPPASGNSGHPRILILRGGAIGDFVVTLPAIRAIREQWPKAHIELIGYRHVAVLASMAGLVDCVRSLESADIARLFSTQPELSNDRLNYFRSFHKAVSYLYDPDGLVKTNLADIGLETVLYGCPLVRELHAVETLFKPLESLAIYPAAEETPKLKLPPSSLERGRRRIKNIGADPVAIHPGSGSPQKNWPLEKFLLVEQRLRTRTGQRAFFVLGEADRDIAECLLASSCDVPILRGLTLAETTETIAASHRYLGNDSGITHIAAALGIHTVALYGPSSPALWGIRGNHTRQIVAAAPTTDALADLSVDAVWNKWIAT